MGGPNNPVDPPAVARAPAIAASPSKDWQNIKTAPRDGEIIFSYWQDIPVFIAWSDGRKPRVGKGPWPWSRERVVDSGDHSGFRVLSWSPRLGWGFNGNCHPYWPKYWRRLPVKFWADGDAKPIATLDADEAHRRDTKPPTERGG